MEKRFYTIKMILRRIMVGVVMSAVMMTFGCTTPVGVSRVNESVVYKQINSSALTSNAYSSYTSVVLHRHGLQKKDFLKDPEQFIQKLHEIACHDERRDLLLSLSELCFLAARQAEAKQAQQVFDNRDFYYYPVETDEFFSTHEPIKPKKYFLGSAVYAYLFLLGEGSEAPPGPYDRRFRMACDLYNRSLVNVLTFSEGKVELKENSLPLPVGAINISVKILETPWNPDEFATILPADTFEVHGLSVRNRVPGLGAPILAVRQKGPGTPVASAVSATIFLEIKGRVEDLKDGNCSGEVSIFSSMSESEIMVNDKKIPLEIDLTAPIAYSLNDPVLWSVGRNLFRMGRSLFEPGIYPVQPYKQGLIPLVMVHGTMSSPVWWAEMLNTLMSDPQIRKHFQVWLYLYDSGKPVAFSALHLRETIDKQIMQCDPSGQDSALKNIVVMGHSQGGLLTRLTVVETGDTMIKAITGKTLNELELSPKELELVKQYAVFHPLPGVRRVIFISTPHRGSILAGSFARRMAARFIALPREVVQTGTELLNISERFSLVGKVKSNMARTSIDSMAPDNPSLLAIAELPFPLDVKAHSIIAIKGDEQPPDGDDGVVSYKSAHIDGVESELVVPYGHSCQMEPLVIEEVRRILIEHLGDMEYEK